jgi:hypothetical protein
MVAVWINAQGGLYQGDCAAGARAATAEELTTWQAARAAARAPRSVSNFQGRTALRLAGIFDAVQNAITAIPDPTQRAIAQDAFDRGDFDRDSEMLNQVLGQLGHDDAFRDALFAQAAAIKV